MKPSTLLLLVAFALTLVACNDYCTKKFNENLERAFVKIPSSDRTPPAAFWIVEKDKGPTVTYSGEYNTIPAKEGDVFHLKFIGDDSDGGVKKLTVNQGGGVSCINIIDPNQASTGNFDYANPTHVKDYSATTDGMALKRETIVLSDERMVFTCSENEQFRSGSKFYEGNVENFHGGKSKSALQIIVSKNQ